jgi:hypothetical protein
MKNVPLEEAELRSCAQKWEQRCTKAVQFWFNSPVNN